MCSRLLLWVAALDVRYTVHVFTLLQWVAASDVGYIVHVAMVIVAGNALLYFNLH